MEFMMGQKRQRFKLDHLIKFDSWIDNAITKSHSFNLIEHLKFHLIHYIFHGMLITKGDQKENCRTTQCRNVCV